MVAVSAVYGPCRHLPTRPSAFGAVVDARLGRRPPPRSISLVRRAGRAVRVLLRRPGLGPGTRSPVRPSGSLAQREDQVLDNVRVSEDAHEHRQRRREGPVNAIRFVVVIREPAGRRALARRASPRPPARRYRFWVSIAQAGSDRDWPRRSRLVKRKSSCGLDRPGGRPVAQSVLTTSSYRWTPGAPLTSSMSHQKALHPGQFTGSRKLHASSKLTSRLRTRPQGSDGIVCRPAAARRPAPRARARGRSPSGVADEARPFGSAQRATSYVEDPRGRAAPPAPGSSARRSFEQPFRVSLGLLLGVRARTPRAGPPSPGLVSSIRASSGIAAQRCRDRMQAARAHAALGHVLGQIRQAPRPDRRERSNPPAPARSLRPRDRTSRTSAGPGPGRRGCTRATRARELGVLGHGLVDSAVDSHQVAYLAHTGSFLGGRTLTPVRDSSNCDDDVDGRVASGRRERPPALRSPVRPGRRHARPGGHPGRGPARGGRAAGADARVRARRLGPALAGAGGRLRGARRGVDGSAAAHRGRIAAAGPSGAGHRPGRRERRRARGAPGAERSDRGEATHRGLAPQRDAPPPWARWRCAAGS